MCRRSVKAYNIVIADVFAPGELAAHAIRRLVANEGGIEIALVVGQICHGFNIRQFPIVRHTLNKSIGSEARRKLNREIGKLGCLRHARDAGPGIARLR